MLGKDVRTGIPWIKSKSKLAAQSPIISLPNRLNTCFIHSSLHKQSCDNSKVTLVTQFFNAIARFRFLYHAVFTMRSHDPYRDY